MSMRDKFEFREPLGLEPDGTYITAGQMQFYLNRPSGSKNFKTGSRDFFQYYNICRVYNVISDLMEEDPTVAIFYWDTKKGRIAMAFPSEGIVSESLSTLEEEFSSKEESEYFEDTEEEDEEDEEEWGGNPFAVG